MKSFRTIMAVCTQNIRKWGTNYRMWMAAIIALIFIHSFTKGIGIFCAQVGISVSPWIYPFLYSDRYMKLLFFFPLILLFCDAPFVDDNQAYVILRAKRLTWGMGQITYIMIGSALYFLFLVFGTIVLNLPYMMFTGEWGKVLGTLANTNAAQVTGVTAIVSGHVINLFTPLQAMWFTFLLSWLSGIFLGLLIYVVNTISNTRVLGTLAASFFLVFSAVVSRKPELQWFSPISWNTIGCIDIGGTTRYPTITYILTAYAILIVLLAVCALAVNRKKAIVVLPPV